MLPGSYSGSWGLFSCSIWSHHSLICSNQWYSFCRISIMLRRIRHFSDWLRNFLVSTVYKLYCRFVDRSHITSLTDQSNTCNFPSRSSWTRQFKHLKQMHKICVISLKIICNSGKASVVNYFKLIYKMTFINLLLRFIHQ